MSIFKRNRTAAINEDNRIDNWAYMWMAMFMVLGYVLFRVVFGFFGAVVLKWFGVAIIAALLLSLAYSFFKKTTNEKRIVHVILFVAIIIRLYYMIVTAQKEYSSVNYEIIQTMCNEFTLPNVSQPLYYLIAAVLSYVSSLVTFTASAPMEIARLVNEYFGVASVIVVYYILCELEANDTAIYIGTAITALHPGFIIAGGEISPTMLFTMLMMFTVLYLSRWNNFTDGYNFILMSVCFGLAALTDMRAFVLAPVIAVLIVINLVRVFKLKQAFNLVATIAQTVAGVLSWVVLSFAYPIRNIMVGQSTGLLNLMNDISQNAGQSDFPQKFFSFSVNELLEVYVAPERNKNAWAYLIKSSMFGSRTDSYIDINIVRIMILLGAAVFAIIPIMGIMSMFSRIDVKKKVNVWTMVALFVSVIAYYMLVNLGRPYPESMVFDIIAPVLGIGVAMTAIGMKILSNKKKLSFVSGILYFLIVVVEWAFCISSAVYYMIIF